MLKTINNVKDISDGSDLADVFSYADLGKMKSILDGGEAFGVCHINGKDRCGALLLARDKYDSEFFGARMGKVYYVGPEIDSDILSDIVGAVDKEALKNDFKYLFFKLSSEHFFMGGVLANNGFILCDSAVELHAPYDSLEYDLPGGYASGSIGFASSGDEDGIKDIAATSFIYSRLYKIGFVDKETLDKYQSTWALNLLRDKDCTVFKYDDPTGIGGFLAFKVDEETRTGRVVLIAVHPDKRRKGVGRALLAHTINWAKGKVDDIYIKTQSDNIPAVALYDNMGFSIVNKEQGYHKILGD